MRGARKWMTLSSGASGCPVYVCHTGHPYLEEPEGEVRYGWFNGEIPRIVINLDQPDEAMRECVFHEAHHLQFDKSGMSHTFFNASAKKEEDFIRTLSPHMYSMWRQSKMIRFPPIPRF